MTGLDNLIVVPAGRQPANPAKFVRQPRVAQFLVATRHVFDIVIVDMPSVTSDNAVPLALQTDGVVMVVRTGVTPREVVSEAIETVGANRVTSVILNRSKAAAPIWLQRRFGRL
jgi:Mrp family chromosome partitioning ATPase